MKRFFFSAAAALSLLTLSVGMVGQADAQIIVPNIPNVPDMQVMYDDAGIPIWGYGTRGRAIYAYSPEGLPVYSFAKVYSGCYVPTWDFLGTYQGPKWPRGIHRKLHGNPYIRPGQPGPGGHAGAVRPGKPGGMDNPGKPGGMNRPGNPGGMDRPGQSGGMDRPGRPGSPRR